MKPAPVVGALAGLSFGLVSLVASGADYPAAKRGPLLTDTGMPTELVAKVAAIGRVIDPVPFVDQANELRDALCRSARGCQGFLVLAKHNHLTQVQSINTADSTLTRHVLDFVK